MPLMVAAMAGELRKGLVPRSGIPGAVKTYLRMVDFLSARGFRFKGRGKPLSKVSFDEYSHRAEESAARTYSLCQYFQGRLAAREAMLPWCAKLSERNARRASRLAVVVDSYEEEE